MDQQALKVIDDVCKDFDGNGIFSVGAIGALKAMAHHWKDHLAEGHPPKIISDDVIEMAKQLEIMRAEIMRRIQEASASTENVSDVQGKSDRLVVIHAKLLSAKSGLVSDWVFAGESREEAMANMLFACSHGGRTTIEHQVRNGPFEVGTLFRTEDGYKLRLAEDGCVTDGDLCYYNAWSFLAFVEAAQIVDEKTSD